MKRYATMVVVAVATACVVWGGWYVATADEDSAPVWVCDVMGNGNCGPDAPWISFR